jgi:hypothetical protein
MIINIELQLNTTMIRKVYLTVFEVDFPLTQNRVIKPSLEDIENLPTPLNSGEKQVLDFFCEYLPLEWEIYVQPPLNGLRPDFVLLNPNFGIAVFEVKNWSSDTKYYHGPNSNRLLMKNASGKTVTTNHQPIDQVTNYRSEIKDLYCPSMFEKTNFSLITAGLIFPQWSDEKINQVFNSEVREKKKFEKKFSNNPIAGSEALAKGNIRAIFPNYKTPSAKLKKVNVLELRNWVTSSEFDVEQGRFPRLNNEQSRFVETRTKSGYRRIKGPAGSGKSIVLAARAAKLQSWQNKRVLVLSYNITLLNFLRDQAVRYDRGAADAVFLHYHSWAKRICNEFGMSSHWSSLFSGKEKIEDKVFYDDVPKLVDKAIEQWREQNPDSFQEQCFDAILVDEGQDFNLNWWSNLRQVLNTNGEMVLVSDPTQDLYDTASSWTDEAMAGAGFSGPWSELKDCYRMPKDLHERTNTFAQTFLPKEKERVLVTPREDDLVKEKVVLKWVQVKPEDHVSSMIDEILRLPTTASKLTMADLSYADIVFLTFDKLTGNQIKDHLTEKGFNISSVFATDPKKNQLEKLRFYKGSGRMKGATIHSFKGLESRALVVNIPVLNSSKDLSATYAALTRLKAMPEGSFLTVVCSDDKLAGYGETWKGQAVFRQMNPIEEVSDNQTGVTYATLFADCLEGANTIDLTDPYIRMPHQFANLREFIKTCRLAQNSKNLIHFNLETGEHSDQDRYTQEEQNIQFENVTQFAKNLDIEFTWRRTRAHDRHIKTNHGWKIILGRGLDIFKFVKDNPEAKNDYSLRHCKEFKVTYFLTGL